jgi:hypothetical protein
VCEQEGVWLLWWMSDHHFVLQIRDHHEKTTEEMTKHNSINNVNYCNVPKRSHETHLPVKFPNKANEFALAVLAEILWKNSSFECYLVSNQKSIAALDPLEDTRIALVVVLLRFLFDDIHQMLGESGRGGM